MSIINKRLIVFDLDGTLVESKSPMDNEMADLLMKLLKYRMIAIISGGGFVQFEKQIPLLKGDEELLRRLFFFPTTATRFYRYDDGWQQVYADEMTSAERQKIKDAFESAFRDVGYHHPQKLYGEVVEDRGTQVTFSALGQEAPLELKKQWRDTQDRRVEIVQALEKYLPEFEIKIPGVTSIDVTRKGIDKGYGIQQMKKMLNVSVPEMIFVGDALYEGGNDYPVKRVGVETIAVLGPAEAKKLINSWLQELSR